MLKLKLKLQYFSHLIWRADSLEGTLMLGKIEDRRRRGRQRTRCWWHHRLNGHEFEQAPGDGEGQGSLACCSPAKSIQSCPTLCDPIDGSPPGSPIPGILQARILEWDAISFSNAWKWKVKIEREVAQSCPTLSDPMDCSLPGSSVHRIFQARVLEWGAIAFSDAAVHGVAKNQTWLSNWTTTNSYFRCIQFTYSAFSGVKV